jgi:hypothetical protein
VAVVRFHKAKKVSAADTKLLIGTSASSLNANVVVSHNDCDWYDVRLMTHAELQDFVDDLLRAERILLQSGLLNPH